MSATPAGTPELPDPYGDLLDAAPCPRHPGYEARLRCAGCGAKICAACGGLFEGRRLCPACLSPRAAAEERDRLSPPPEVLRKRPWAGGVVFLLVTMAILGVVCVGLLPSIESAKRKAAIRDASRALRQVFDAAKLYAEDNADRLPVPADRRLSTLVDDLERREYLRRRPKNLVEGTVVTASAAASGDPWAIYAVEVASHPSTEDGEPARWVLCQTGQVHEMSVTATARALAQGSVYGVVTGTASPWVAPWLAPATATASAAAPTPTAAAPTPTAAAATATAAPASGGSKGGGP